MEHHSVFWPGVDLGTGMSVTLAAKDSPELGFFSWFDKRNFEWLSVFSYACVGTDFNFSFLLTGIIGGVRRTMLASLGWGGIMLAMQMCLVWLEVGKQSLLCLKPFWTAKVPQNTSVKKRKTVFSLLRLKLEVTLDSLGERTKCRHHWNRFPISKTKLQLLTDLLFRVDPLFISQF